MTRTTKVTLPSVSPILCSWLGTAQLDLLKTEVLHRTGRVASGANLIALQRYWRYISESPWLSAGMVYNANYFARTDGRSQSLADGHVKRRAE